MCLMQRPTSRVTLPTARRSKPVRSVLISGSAAPLPALKIDFLARLSKMPALETVPLAALVREGNGEM